MANIYKAAKKVLSKINPSIDLFIKKEDSHPVCETTKTQKDHTNNRMGIMYLSSMFLRFLRWLAKIFPIADSPMKTAIMIDHVSTVLPKEGNKYRAAIISNDIPQKPAKKDKIKYIKTLNKIGGLVFTNPPRL